jgi:hypothetical protein
MRFSIMARAGGIFRCCGCREEFEDPGDHVLVSMSSVKPPSSIDSIDRVRGVKAPMKLPDDDPSGSLSPNASLIIGSLIFEDGDDAPPNKIASATCLSGRFVEQGRNSRSSNSMPAEPLVEVAVPPLRTESPEGNSTAEGAVIVGVQMK